MALIKPLPTDFGIDATYWHILAIEANRLERSLRVTVAGYLDGPTRRNGHRPVAVTVLSLSGPDFPGTDGGIDYAAVYRRLKAPAQGSTPNTPASLLADAVDD